VGRIFGVNLGADGFFLEEHPKLGPLNTATDGVFLAGCCQKPMDIPDTVSQASGAAAKALSLATRGRVEVPPTISWIDPDSALAARCASICALMAPLNSIRDWACRRSIRRSARAAAAVRGFCPSGAAQQTFQEQANFAEIDSIFNAVEAI
jgi:heterodisulfide reductase subunit A